MTASHRDVAAAFLHRAGLFAGILAVLAGILGMHVVTGSHSVHSLAALTAAVGTATEHIADGASVAGEHCSCSDGCTSMHTMMVSCTPSKTTGSLSAPLPGTKVFGVISNARAPGAVPVSYSYRPCIPSPGELSVSRT